MSTSLQTARDLLLISLEEFADKLPRLASQTGQDCIHENELDKLDIVSARYKELCAQPFTMGDKESLGRLIGLVEAIVDYNYLCVRIGQDNSQHRLLPVPQYELLMQFKARQYYEGDNEVDTYPELGHALNEFISRHQNETQETAKPPQERQN
ncbi:hypothetical protein JW859_07910 [bacterium]|nr:hypothetical protein [bacterium]